MTDAEVRARLGLLRTLDPVARFYATVNCIQLAANFLFVQDDSAYWTWLGCIMLTAPAFGWGIGKFMIARDDRASSDLVRRRYADVLDKRFRDAGIAKSLKWFLGVMAVVVFAGEFAMIQAGKSTFMGTSIAISLLLQSLSWHHTGTKVLPRLEREQAEYRAAAAA